MQRTNLVKTGLSGITPLLQSKALLKGIFPNSSHASYLLEKGIAAHFNILAWRNPQTEELCGLEPMELQRVGHD